MEQKICQCCAMPIDETTFGTEADGSKNEEYCQYCYADGHFTKECTMDEMIELNLNYLEEFNKDSEGIGKIGVDADLQIQAIRLDIIVIAFAG